ncbi:MAG: exonuclease domain-containing protein [Bacteroidetes bacterium]|nr:exonuclease domain-containing protein [Bacteroidota bacterium]
METTGSAAAGERIIEFAAYKVRRGKIIDEFSTLVNPGRHIPNFIQNMTGISNEIVYRAPSFRDISVKVAEFLEGTVFTAHNSQFDYGFVRSELARSGLDFEMPQLCTRKLSSRVFPHLQRKALDHVCHHLGIKIGDRHRAYGDARATAHLLIELLEIIRERHEVVDLEELLRFQNVPYRIDRHIRIRTFSRRP